MRSSAVSPLMAAGGLLYAVYCYALVALGGAGAALVHPSHHGMVFNSMALNLVQGRFDVDPAAVHDEGFVRDGRVYSYFGILPALLRVPLMPFLDLETVPVEGFSRLAALLVSAGGALALLRALSPLLAGGPTGRQVHDLIALALLFSGPPVMIGVRDDIYNEVVLWAWAFAVWFLAGLLPVLRDPATATAGRLALLAGLGGAALLTRPTTGIGLLLALAGVMAVLAWREFPQALRATGAARAALAARALAPTAVVLVAAMVAGIVNYGRWGNPFTFADVRLQQEMLAIFPDRLARLDTYGLFHMERLGFGLMYYFLPVWAFGSRGELLFQDDILRLFDAFELPPSSIFVSDPFTLLLAVAGLASLARRNDTPVAPVPALAAIAGLAVPAALMLVAWYMAFRYRAEFMPMMLLAACIGAAHLSRHAAEARTAKARLILPGLALLVVLQVASAHLHGFLYLASPWGPAHAHVTENLLHLYAGRLGFR